MWRETLYQIYYFLTRRTVYTVQVSPNYTDRFGPTTNFQTNKYDFLFFLNGGKKDLNTITSLDLGWKSVCKWNSNKYVE